MYEYTLARNLSLVMKRTQPRDALFVYLQHSSYQDMLDKHCSFRVCTVYQGGTERRDR